MGKNHHPYIRPMELGSNEWTYTVRAVTDGTRTIVEIYEGDAEEIRNWPKKPIGVGHSVRRKGDRRDVSVGSTIALARALADASENAFSRVKEHLE